MKRFARFAAALVLLLVVVAFAALLWIDSLTETAIEKGGTYALGVETQLESADVGLFSGEFALDGLNVSNPAGFAEPHFLALRKARVELSPSQLLGSRVTIPTLVLEGLALDLEGGPQGTNFGRILENLSRLEGSAAPSEPAPEATGKVFTLQRLELRDLRASVQLTPAGGNLTKLDLVVPEIVVEDLASDMSLGQLCGLVVKVAVQAAMEAGGGRIPEQFMTELRTRLDLAESQARERLDQELTKVQEKLGEGARQLGPEAERALQKASEELGGKLGGFLDKKKKD